jgi:hypothetical protein
MTICSCWVRSAAPLLLLRALTSVFVLVPVGVQAREAGTSDVWQQLQELCTVKQQSQRPAD